MSKNVGQQKLVLTFSEGCKPSYGNFLIANNMVQKFPQIFLLQSKELKEEAQKFELSYSIKKARKTNKTNFKRMVYHNKCSRFNFGHFEMVRQGGLN